MFRRLDAEAGAAEVSTAAARPAGTRAALEAIDTNPVGFVLFERVLLTVHPADCPVRDFFTNRLQNQARPPMRAPMRACPPGAADLMLRMVNHIVDGYLELRAC